MSEPAEPRKPAQWTGCGLWVLAFFVVIIGGCSIGLSLRADPNATQRPATVAAGSGWTLRVYQDASKAPCTELYGEPQQEGSEAPLLAGQCAFATENDADGTSQYKATSAAVGAQVVVFGPVPDDVKSVRLTLTDGSNPTARTADKQGVHYFVQAVDAEDRGPTTLFDANGDQVSVPG